MKIAICGAGHLRHYRKLKTLFYERVMNPLRKFAEVDLFIHSWDTEDTKRCWSYRGQENEGLNHYIDLNVLKEVLPYKYLVLESEENVSSYLNFKNLTSPHGKFSPSYLQGLVNTHHANIEGDVWQHYMFYKISECCKLKKQNEQENGFRYDFCIRYRLDSIPARAFNLDNFRSNRILVDGINKDSLSDRFLIAESQIFDQICSLTCFSETYEPVAPEINLFLHMKKLGLLGLLEKFEIPIYVMRRTNNGDLVFIP